MPSHKQPKAPALIIQEQLRWAAHAHTLIGRADRVYNLAQRADQIRDRLALVESAYTELLSADVESGVKDSARRDYEQFVDFTDDLVEARGKLAHEARESQMEGLAKLESPRRNPAQAELLGKLPTLDLPKFSGAIGEWLAFIGLFDSLVHARGDLSLGQKMAYLVSSLEGEALAVVGHLKLADDSYLIARDLLERRYANTRLLADEYARQLLNLPLLTDRTRLRQDIINPVVVACNSLRRLELPVDEGAGGSFLLLHLVLSRLPLNLRIHFEERYGGDGADHIPSFRDLLLFLEQRCRQVANAAGAAGTSRASEGLNPPGRSSPTPRKAAGAPSGGRRPLPTYTGLVARESPPPPTNCNYCRGSEHRAAACPKLRAKPAKARRNIARDRRWCFSCLERHLQGDCPHQRPCPHCSGPHHEVLCLGPFRAPPRAPSDRTAATGGGASQPPLARDASRSPTNHFAPGLNSGHSPEQLGGHPVRGGGSAPPLLSGSRECSPPLSCRQDHCLLP
ncbi:uncharacterized protein LOC123658953 [Melitaea cinxia]|uniref:uncharacterized protein LOC123658953 n=1 Tax=Melitaea cinxia TaxID=113334 RepID=UPI001E27301E|nr:uncharacterized protein LOC123658953 [Melitaea cinxia]